MYYAKFHDSHIRALFNWVSKVIPQLLWFCIATLCDWLKNLAPLPRPIRSKTKTNRDLLARVFPALGTGDMYLLRALIGSLDCLRLLWFVRVITLVLVLRHWNENRSIYSWCKSVSSGFPNTKKWVEKRKAQPSFLTDFEVFGYLMKHFSSCLIY